jgi:hypothetical protein
MIYTVTCVCGKPIPVRAGDAGSVKRCTCGAETDVPSLSVLCASSESIHPEESNRAALHPVALFGVTFASALVVGIVSGPLLVFLGFWIFTGGRLWLAAQILREMSLPNAMLVVLVPFVPTIFLIKRFDIAWRPFLFGVMGNLAMLVGVSCSVH